MYELLKTNGILLFRNSVRILDPSILKLKDDVIFKTYMRTRMNDKFILIDKYYKKI